MGGVDEDVASGLVAGFFAAMVVGRFAGAQLARRIPPLRQLLGSVAVGLGGALILLATTNPAVQVVGLVVLGLGVSNLFPMLLSLAMASAVGATDIAAPRVSIAAGTGLMIAPVTVGALADAEGVRTAFAVMPLLFGLVVVAAVGGSRRGDPAHP